MSKINWVYHEEYDVSLPAKHRFTASKFSDLFAELKDNKLIERANITRPKMAASLYIKIAHCEDYISKIKNNGLSQLEERRLGLNWSKTLARRSFLAVNGTLLAANFALETGIGCHLAGGTHHAHYSFGSGFCVFNDLAFTALHLLKDKKAKKVLIFDCDVHQGDGTAQILKTNDNVFTCSIHCQNNFPARKASSDLDVGVEDGLSDKEYLLIVQETLAKCVEEVKPDIVLYDAGIDIHEKDELGRLNITDQGCLNRDLNILSYLKDRQIPVATVIGGGYSRDRRKLAQRHSIIFQAADLIFS